MAAAPAAAPLPAGKWQPGVNYTLLVPAQPTSVAPGKVEVLEVFWLACPHCYALEPFIRSWLKSKPAYVEFVRVPVIWQPIHRAHARLYYTLDALGRQDLVGQGLRHHRREQPASRSAGSDEQETLKLQQKFATDNGVSADDFAKAYNSFTVNTNMQRAEEITQRYQRAGRALIVVERQVHDRPRPGGRRSEADRAHQRPDRRRARPLTWAPPGPRQGWRALRAPQGNPTP